MRYKVTVRDWINIIAAIGIIAYMVVFAITIVHGSEPSEEVIAESAAIMSNPHVIEAELVQLSGFGEENMLTEESDIFSTTEISRTEPQEPAAESIYTDKEIELLAIAIYTETGGDSCCDNCRRYTRDVILNRVLDDRYPDSIYGVLTQPGQYAAFGNGVYWPSRASNYYEAEAVERAWRIAREVLTEQYSDIYGKGYIYQAQFVQGTGGFWCCSEHYGVG